MRIAIVCYYTPPQPAIASHRVLRMTRALLAAGHSVHWVTADAARLSPAALDPSLGDLVPEEVTVHGIDGEALITKPAADNVFEKVLRTLAWHMPRRFAWPDSFLSWARRLKRHLPRLVRSHGIDAVVLCCSPHNQILALPRLRAAVPGLRLFVDYRDLLSGNPWNRRSSPRLAARLLRLERRMLAHADTLFLNTEPARERFLEIVGAVDGLDIEVMRNAADYELAANIADTVAEPDLGPGVHVGFFGTLFPRRRLLPVLEALAAIEPTVRQRLTLHVFCDAHDSKSLLEEDLAAFSGELREQVQRSDPLGYIHALRRMQAMDALVLVNGSENSDAIFVPGKLYDYLMARRPVLFTGHPGEASAIVARVCGADWCFTEEQRNGLAEKIASLPGGDHVEVPPDESCTPQRAFAPLLDRLA